VRLNALLDLAVLKPEANVVIFTAGDGYTSQMFVSEIRACTDCLLAFTDQAGVYNLVMPGFGSTYWNKDIVRIDVTP
jgi:DMSO/TMAO reductase YedYZ molybdopterin-dependent catalytic subunit